MGSQVKGVHCQREMSGWSQGKWVGSQVKGGKEVNGQDLNKLHKNKSSIPSCPPVGNLEVRMSYFFRGVVPAAAPVISTASGCKRLLQPGCV